MALKRRMEEVKYQELSSDMKKEVDKIDLQLDATQANLAQINVDTKPNSIQPRKELELSRKEISDAPIYIKPSRRMASVSKPKPEQEKLRKAAWEYVKCIVENYEVRGESVQSWYCPPLSGEDVCEWIVPVNKPVMLPRMVAEHLAARSYNRIVMQDASHKFSGETMGGATISPTELIAVERRRRIDCRQLQNSPDYTLFKSRID